VNPLRWARARLADLYGVHFAKYLLVRGRIDPWGTEAECLFVGNGLTPGILIRKVFASGSEVLVERRIRIRSLDTILSETSPSTDLVVAVLPSRYDPLFRRLSTFTAGKRVRQVVDISGSRFEENRKLREKSRETLRKIRKRGYTFRVSRDNAELRHFYDRMFVPHIRKQYGELARVEDFESVQKQFAAGALILALKSDAPVAGALVRFAGARMEYRRMGVLDADRVHVTQGAQSALFYYMLRYAKDQGFQAVDFMVSLAYLNDGVYLAKRDWGADVVAERDDDDTRLYYFNREGRDRLAEIYARVLPIVEDERGLLLGVLGARDDDSADRKDLVKKYGGQGIHGLLTVGRKGVIRPLS
jgi:hypothetical protein